MHFLYLYLWIHGSSWGVVNVFWCSVENKEQMTFMYQKVDWPHHHFHVLCKHWLFSSWTYFNEIKSLLPVSQCTLVQAFLSTWLQYISGSPAALHGQKYTLTSDVHTLRAKMLMFSPELLQLLLSDLAEEQTSLLLLLGQLTSFLEALLAPGCCTVLLFLYLMTDGVCIPQSSLPLPLLLLLMFDHSFLSNPVEQAEEPNWLSLMEKSRKKILTF